MRLRFGYKPDREGLQGLGRVGHGLDFKTDGAQCFGDPVQRRLRFQVTLQPSIGELHMLSPPARLGRANAEKP